MATEIQLLFFTGFLVNVLISAAALLRDRQAFSLNQIFWVFCLLFMSTVPLLQAYAGIKPWGRDVSPGTMIRANTLLTACLLLYRLLYRRLGGSTATLSFPDFIPDIELRRYRRIALPVFALACLLLLLLSGKGLLLRSAATTPVIGNSALQLLADKLLRGITLYMAMLSLALYRGGQISRRLLLIVLLPAMLCNFPLAVPRYWAATFYMALLLQVSGPLLQRRRYLFRSLLAVAILLLYPVMSIARYPLQEIQARFSSLKGIFSLSFSYGDFDAYTSLCTTMDYVAREGITRGRQLLTVLLFFVPRSWWPAKGVGSGALVNQLPGSDFTNFCSPIFAEGYINFGVPGSILFLAVLAVLLARYDRLYRCAGGNTYLHLFYPVAMGMLFFMLRGDLLSSFAYTCGIFLAGYGLQALLRRRSI